MLKRVSDQGLRRGKRVGKSSNWKTYNTQSDKTSVKNFRAFIWPPQVISITLISGINKYKKINALFFFFFVILLKYITYFCNSLSKVWPSNLQEKSCQDSSEIMAKMSKKVSKKKSFRVFSKVHSKQRKINREREGGAKGKWLNLEKKV